MLRAVDFHTSKDAGASTPWEGLLRAGSGDSATHISSRWAGPGTWQVFMRGLSLSPGPGEPRGDSIYFRAPAAMVVCVGDLWPPASPSACIVKVNTGGASLTPSS